MPPQSVENLELLLEVGRLLSSKLDLPELLHTVMQLAARVVNAETASLLLVDPRTEELYFDVALGLDPELSKTRIRMGEGIAGAVAKEGHPLIINDVSKDPRWSASMDRRSGFVTRSILAAPILLKGRRIGVVEAINQVDGAFTDAHLRLFEAFASQAAVAIENARLFASLREEKAKLSAVFSEMKDAAVLLETDGRLLLANESAKKLFLVGGKEPKTVQEASAALEFRPPLPELLKASSPVRFEASRRSPFFALAGTVSPVRAASGGGLGRLVMIFRDETEERRQEALKRNFLSLISHKLKTPLASVTGYSQLLLEEARKAGEQGMRLKALESINTQGTKLAALVEKLLDYTVLEDIDGAALSRESFPIDDAIKAAVSSLGPWLEEKKGTVLTAPGSGINVSGDRHLISAVIANLIENGIKFSAKEPRKVAVWPASKNGSVEVYIKDEGVGIPPEEQDRIFGKFYQIESSFTGQVEGWGLGLAFARKVVEKHEGRILLESRLGAGTTVIVRLPAAG